MINRLLDNDRFKSASQYITAVVLCMLILGFALKLWRADLRMPLHYNGDALLHAMFVKGIVENGWYWQNPSIGMPNGLRMYDFPAVDNSAAIILWFISLFTSDPFRILNIFYLLTFPLVTVSSLYVLRQFNLPYSISLSGSLLYTFLPYHFMRDESHLFLSAYYSIPLVVLVLVWIASGKFFGTVNQRFNPRGYRFVLSVIVCILIGSSGIYYPFFSCFLLFVAGISGSLDEKTLRPLGVAAILIAVTFSALVINLSPTIVNIYQEGNAGVTHRSPAGPEIYGLKISQLLLPVTGHRLRLLNELKKHYNEHTQVTENDAATLGIVGSIGFLALLAHLFYRRRLAEDRQDAALLADLSILNIFAVLLGTIGGLGSLFALFVSAGIRSYNRISVFIAFFSLLAVAIGLDQVYRKVKSSKGRIGFHLLMALVLVAGILDQTTKGFVPDYTAIKAEFRAEAEFVRRIEGAVRPGSMVFQLPYVPFPERPPVNKMVDYDHLRGYLHSKTLRWSYGAMKNRESDRWQEQIATLPVDELVEALAFAGFSGVYLDRRGYEDNGAAKETELSRALQTTGEVSANSRLVFFNMTDYSQRLRSSYSDAEWQTKQDLTLHPVMLEWAGGFYGLETAPGREWRWCAGQGELRIKNTSQRERRIDIEMALASGHEQYDELTIDGPLLSEQLKTNWTLSRYARTITVPPGNSLIRLVSKARPVDAPLDPRVLVFRVENFRMKELE